jgi:hypothetical protein
MSPCHPDLIIVTKINKAKQKKMQTLTKPVTHNKATSCNSVPSLTTETFPYLSDFPSSSSSPPDMEQPTTKRVQQKSMSTELQAFL